MSLHTRAAHFKNQRGRDDKREERRVMTKLRMVYEGGSLGQEPARLRECSGFVECELGCPGEIFNRDTAAEQDSAARCCRDGHQNRRRN